MQPRLNPLAQLRQDLRALADRERVWPTHVQVPRERAMDLVGMNAQRWAEGTHGLLTEVEIDELLTRTFKEGPSALTGLYVVTTRLTVAARVEDDCADLTILDGRPMGDAPPAANQLE